MSNHGFDAEGFYAALDMERKSKGKTWKQVAKEAEVSASTLTRMGQGKRPDIDSLSALAVWSGLDADKFILGKSTSKRSAPLAEIATLLRTDRNLSPEGAAALEGIIRSAYEHLRKVKDGEAEEGV